MLARAALRRPSRRLPAVTGSLRPAACRALLRHGAAPLSSTPSESALRDILERVAAGELGAAEAVEVVQQASAYEEIDQFAKIDHQRTKRTGARHARIRPHRPRGRGLRLRAALAALPTGWQTLLSRYPRAQGCPRWSSARTKPRHTSSASWRSSPARPMSRWSHESSRTSTRRCAMRGCRT